jgi:hypothetical protein
VRANLGPRAAALAALALAGCGTTTSSGEVGATFSGGGLKVTVERVDLHTLVPMHDITGLSTPAPGNRLVAARVRVCNNNGPAVGQDSFGIGLAGGGHGSVKFPTTNYADSFSFVDSGCAVGWVVFEIPLASTPTQVQFRFDDSGSGAPSAPGRPESHERFSWAIE